MAAGSNERKLELKDLPTLRRLGQGHSGYLYETEWGGKRYARKDFPLGSVELNRLFETEVQPLFDLDHPNLVNCVGYTLGKSSCSLVQEYVEENLQNTIRSRIEEQRKKSSRSTSTSTRVLDVDEIRNLVSSRGKKKEIATADKGSLRCLRPTPFEGPEAIAIISQIATGMKYLHDNEVVHGDLKPRNMLVYSESGERKVKLADFGLSETKEKITLVSERSRHSEKLTWKAPECLEEGVLIVDSDEERYRSEIDSAVDNYRSKADAVEEVGRIRTAYDFLESRLAKADVYSFGLTCIYILGGKLPYPDVSLTKFQERRMRGYRSKLPPACPLNLKLIIDMCLKFIPSNRPTFTIICAALQLVTERLALTHHKVVAPSKFDMMTFNCINISSTNNNNNNSNAGIPVGFRFHPTDEELVGCYLLDKISRPPPDPRDDLRIIRELDLYRHEPWDISEVCKIPGDHSANQNNWYFFSHKDKKYPTGNRANRATKAGFWRATGRDKCIQTRGAVGMRKTLVFYRGHAPRGQKTDWIMHEFRLDAPGEAVTSSIHNRHSAADHEDAGAWVVCRVFRKTKNLKSKGGDSNNSNNNDTPTTSVEEDHQMALLPEITDSTEKFSSVEGEHVDYPPLDMLHYNHCKQELLSLTDYSHHELAPGALMLPNEITSSSDSMFPQQRTSYVEYNTFGQQQQQARLGVRAPASSLDTVDVVSGGVLFGAGKQPLPGPAGGAASASTDPLQRVW